MIVEQLDARGRVVHRYRLGSGPVTIGRGYDNDIILDDPSVEPRHVRLDPEGENTFRFTDLGSVNGIWDARLRQRVAGGTVRSGLELRLGRTVLRFAAPDLPVTPALADPAARGGIERRLLDPWTSILLVFVVLATAGIDAWLDSTDGFTASAFLTPGLAALSVAAVWAGAWGLANRVTTHRSLFLAHLGWVAAVGTAAVVLRVLAEWIGFFFPAVPSACLTWTGDFGLFAALLAGHLWLVTEWDARRRWRVSGFAAVLIALVVWLLAPGELAREGEIPRSALVLKPVAARLVPARSAEQFFDRVRGLAAEVDGLADANGEER